MTAAPSMAEVLADLIADHPMWIGDDGRPLDYLPARESLIAGFVASADAALADAGFGHVASVEQDLRERIAAHCEERDDALAAASNLEHDYDNRGERLWRLAAQAGHVPSESDNDATAELVIRQAIAHAEAAEAQVADLQRWKDEALPVMSGLQELGRALDLPLGERITGERALEAVQALVAQVAAVRSLMADARRSAGGPFVAKVDVLVLERVLDGEALAGRLGDERPAPR